jgi:hypothetical protein
MEDAIRKETLVLSAMVITWLAVVWVVADSVLGLCLAAAIPFTYQVVSVVNLILLAKTKRTEPAAHLRECSAGRASMRHQAVPPEHDKRRRSAGRRELGKHKIARWT